MNNMVKRILFLIIAGFCIISCSKTNRLMLTNPVGIDRPDEAVIITAKQFSENIQVNESKLPVFKVNEKLVPSQLDDLDADGKWDEVVLLLEVGFVTSDKYPVFEKRTNLRLGIIQSDSTYKEVDSYQAPRCDNGFKIIAQGESVAWENDKFGFRVYFDCRNVKDLYGKLKPGMILDKIGTPELGSYHELADWGMDILHCGSSLGSGGIAILRNDSLYRLGSTEVYEYRKIAEGPLRSMFDLKYKGWNVGGEKMEAIERISIYPGKYWFESDVTFNGCREGDQIVTGIVTTKLNKEPFEFDASGYKCIGTHDVQSLNNDELGMAVLAPSGDIGKIRRAPKTNYFDLGYKTVVEKSFSNIISETYYLGQKCRDNQPEKHYFFAVWGLENKRWKTAEGFKDYIKTEAELLAGKIIIGK
jgi:hypothetical protein